MAILCLRRTVSLKTQSTISHSTSFIHDIIARIKSAISVVFHTNTVIHITTAIKEVVQCAVNTITIFGCHTLTSGA